MREMKLKEEEKMAKIKSQIDALLSKTPTCPDGFNQLVKERFEKALKIW